MTPPRTLRDRISRREALPLALLLLALPRYCLRRGPGAVRPFGSGRFTFAFGDRGLRHGGRRQAAFALPDYPLARVRTGQFASGERLRDAEFAFPAG